MRFKELRGLGLSLLLMLLDIYLCYLGIINNEKIKLVIAAVFGFIILLSLFIQYYIRVLNDCIFMYRHVAVILFPCLINFKDIEEIEMKSKHHVILKTENKKEHLYVMNGQKLYNILNEKMEVYRHEKG